jgi:hypothetical protein
LGRRLLVRWPLLVLAAALATVLVGGGAFWWTHHDTGSGGRGVVEREVGPEGGSIRLGDDVVIEVPSGAAAGPVRLRVERLRAEEVPPPQEGLVAVGVPVRVTLLAGELSGPVRLELRYDPTKVPEGMPEEALFLARYDEDAGRWVALLNSQVDTQGRRVVVEVDHFSVLNVFAFARDWLLNVWNEFIDVFQTFVAKKVSTVQSACGRPDGVFWEPVDQAWEVLLGCPERDGNDIVVKVANNRSYGLLVGYDIPARSHSIELPSASVDLVQAFSILMGKVEAWALREQANVAAALAGSSPIGGIIYLPPGAMVTLRSSSWEGAKNIIAGPTELTLATDALLALVDGLRLVLPVHLGVDPWSSMGALADLDLALKCTSGAPYALVSSSWTPMWPCLLSELKRVLPQLGLNVLAALVAAGETIADLGNRLTAIVEMRWDAFTLRWPAKVNVTVARLAPQSTPQVRAASSPTPPGPAPTPTPWDAEVLRAFVYALGYWPEDIVSTPTSSGQPLTGVKAMCSWVVWANHRFCWVVHFFLGNSYLGTNTLYTYLGYIEDLSRAGDNALRVSYRTYGPHDPFCCPSVTGSVTYTWAGDRLVASADPPQPFGEPYSRWGELALARRPLHVWVEGYRGECSPNRIILPVGIATVLKAIDPSPIPGAPEPKLGPLPGDTSGAVRSVSTNLAEVTLPAPGSYRIQCGSGALEIRAVAVPEELRSKLLQTPIIDRWRWGL